MIFVDPECPPCQDVMQNWQEKVDRGLLAESLIFGVTRGSLEKSGPTELYSSFPVTLRNHRRHLCGTSTGSQCIIGHPPGSTLIPCSRQ